MSNRKKEEAHRRAQEKHTRRLIEKGGLKPSEARERARQVGRENDRRRRDD